MDCDKRQKDKKIELRSPGIEPGANPYSCGYSLMARIDFTTKPQTLVFLLKGEI